ncbi:phosphatidylinositol 4-kinase gamma 4-like [Olea europaea var. sylvestris]|uniref:phosphatidylinositol 4-kinase gamma 4-like n=1 Tax=Olea europaea var. sylvestris TaxID=158386 RepID=UPI000C1D3A89|nr:phosphatidylinositol 4-kinase gamma 4-like [Olea europaea var. sylvestris]
MSSAGIIAIRPACEESMIFSQLPPAADCQESILIYVAMSGSKVPMQVLESDSIESVKLRIQTCKGFVVKNQKLVCKGRELARSNSLVRDYGVIDGNVLHLVLRLSDLQVINVRTCCGKEFTFHVERSQDIGYIKHQITKNRNLESIDDQEVFCNGEPVEDKRLINDICKDNNDAVIHLFVRKSVKIRGRPVEKNFELSIVAPQKNDEREYDVDMENRHGRQKETEHNLYVPRKSPGRDMLLEPVVVNPKIQLAREIRDWIDSTRDGLYSRNYPIRSLEGTGGAYFMLDASGSKYLSVFKPIDEEPMAMNNPRGLPLSEDGEGLKKGTRVGQGAIRECAVYLLDHPKSGRRSFSGELRGFAGVPPTVLVTCLHNGFNHPKGVTAKIGSLQMFMENDGSCEDMGPGAFPVEEVHKIAVLDMRVANADRHAGNILVSKGQDGQTVLIPIDHGYCLPDSFEDCTFDWLYWPQARQPFSTNTLEYIKSLDAEEDIALLKFYGWDLPLECARILRISTMLLKKGAQLGLTPFAIGNIMCRKTVKKESMMEEIVQEALDSVLPCSSEAALLEPISCIMDRRLEEII